MVLDVKFHSKRPWASWRALSVDLAWLRAPTMAATPQYLKRYMGLRQTLPARALPIQSPYCSLQP
jgi:hypothetical protein